MLKNRRCETCSQLKPHRFVGTQAFLEQLQVFQKLLESGEFAFVSSNFELEHPQNADGCWLDDIMEYTICCKACGRQYHCSCDTYHGLGGLDKGGVWDKAQFSGKRMEEIDALFEQYKNHKLEWLPALQVLGRLQEEGKIILYAGTYSLQDALTRPLCDCAKFYFYTTTDRSGYCFYINPMGVGIKTDNEIFKFKHRRLYRKGYLSNCFWGEQDFRSGEFFKPKKKRTAASGESKKRKQTEKDIRWNWFIAKICKQDMDTLNEVQRKAALCFWYDAEVNNGGHSEYFDVYPKVNPQELVEALSEVSYPAIADNFQKAVSDKSDKNLEEADTVYYNFSPALCDCLMDFVERHKNEICNEW